MHAFLHGPTVHSCDILGIDNITIIGITTSIIDRHYAMTLLVYWLKYDTRIHQNLTQYYGQQDITRKIALYSRVILWGTYAVMIRSRDKEKLLLRKRSTFYNIFTQHKILLIALWDINIFMAAYFLLQQCNLKILYSNTCRHYFLFSRYQH